MIREKVLLSDLDLKILRFLKEPKTITEILDEFDLVFSQSKLHLDRLNNLVLLETKKIGTFKEVVLNKKGKELLQVLEDHQ